MPQHEGLAAPDSQQVVEQYAHFHAWLQRQHHTKAASRVRSATAGQSSAPQEVRQQRVRRAASPPALQHMTQARPASAPPAAPALLIRPCSAAVTASTVTRQLDRRLTLQPQQQQAVCGANRRCSTAAGCQRPSSACHAAAQLPAATHAGGVAPRWLAGWGEEPCPASSSWGGGSSSSRPQAAGNPVRPISSPLGRLMSATTVSGSPARPSSPWAALGTDAPLRWQQLSTHDNGSQQQQQQQCCQRHAAEQLFKRLPLSGHACMTRDALQLLAVGLQQELHRVGAPLELPETLPNLHPPSDQLLPELEVWSKLTAEVCRQVQLECTQRGHLLRLAVGRQQELLLCQCDALQQELQQDNARLRAAGEAKQAKFVSAMQELEHLQERLRRGRFDLIQQQVQEARVELEKRMLRQVEHRLNQAQAAAAVAAAEREHVLLQAVTAAAGHEVAPAVRQQLDAFTRQQRLQQLSLTHSGADAGDSASDLVSDAELTSPRQACGAS